MKDDPLGLLTPQKKVKTDPLGLREEKDKLSLSLPKQEGRNPEHISKILVRVLRNLWARKIPCN